MNVLDNGVATISINVGTKLYIYVSLDELIMFKFVSKCFKKQSEHSLLCTNHSFFMFFDDEF